MAVNSEKWSFVKGYVMNIIKVANSSHRKRWTDFGFQVKYTRWFFRLFAQISTHISNNTGSCAFTIFYLFKGRTLNTWKFSCQTFQEECM